MRSSSLAWSLAAVVGLTGCGVIYTSPSVSDGTRGYNSLGDASFNVEVVPLSFETALAANLQPYVPARLPAFFSPSGARTGASSPAVVSSGFPASATRLPPPLEVSPYRIGVADVLLLSANTAEATLNDLPGLISAQSKRQGYIVQDDGAIAIPDVGRIRVAGLSMEGAEGRIFDALVEKRFDPTFSLEISEFNSQRVSVGGSVAAPTVVPITLKPLYLQEALQMAGGVRTSDPDYTAIRLYRDGDLYQIPLNEFYSNRGMREVLLKDGDSIFVDTGYEIEQARAYFEEQLRLRQALFDEQRFDYTLRQLQLEDARLSATLAADQREAFKDRVELGAVERGYAYIAGEVQKPHRLALPFETRAYLADLLFQEEGINMREGDYSEIYILRAATRPEEAGGVTAYHLNASNAANLAVATQMEIRPGDVVFVAEHPVTAWNRVITQLTPSLFSQVVGVSGI